MAWTAYLASVAVLYWIYDGYGRFLSIASGLFRDRRRWEDREVASTEEPSDRSWPSVTVLLTVHNEEEVVEDRLRNLLDCDYPADQLGVVVASDGSTDSTNERVRAFGTNVRLFETEGLGKTETQNRALETIDSDIVVFTDADIRFDHSFIREIVGPFDDPRVGAVDGRLLYNDDSRDASARTQGYYWRYELNLRLQESRCGLLAVVAGACFAARRSCLVPMDPSVGEDCIVPLDVVSQGFEVRHHPAARAYDRLDEGTAFTLRRRVRMTLRNWQGTWTRASLLNPLRHPGYAFSLWSHKILRWLSPVFLAVAVISSTLLLITRPGVLTLAAALPLLSLLLIGLTARPAAACGLRLPASGTASSFLLANYAFLLGVIGALRGRRIRSYRRTA